MKKLNLNDVDSEALVNWIQLTDIELDQVKSDLERLLTAVESFKQEKANDLV